MKHFKGISFFGLMVGLIVIPNIVYAQKKPKYKIATSYWQDMSEGQIALSLEKTKKEINYCLKHIGEKFTDRDKKQIGEESVSLYGAVGVITYGLVAYKCQNPSKAAGYFYKDSVELRKCQSERNIGARKEGCFAFGSGPGDYNPLSSAVKSWKESGMYAEALKHYSEYFDDTFLLRPENATRDEKMRFFEEQLKNDMELKNKYTEFMREWANVKKLAKTEKPKPLDPAVQNHEWFYSDKQEEVLKALAYYSQNKVQFMLEKALAHKAPIVAEKAKEYLENLKKGETNETENKKP